MNTNKDHPILIIVEGMDNTGKTTLIEILHKTLGVKKVLSEGRKTPEEMMDRVERFLESSESVIHDRFHAISDQVYSSVLKRESPFRDTNRGRKLFEKLASTPHVIIYARPPRSEILGFSDGRDQMEGVVENGPELLKAYDRMIRSMINEGEWNIVLYDYTDENSLPQIIQKLKGELGK